MDLELNFEFLEKLNVKEMTLDEIKCIKKSRPIPNIFINTGSKSGKAVKFNIKYYNEFKWLAGCKKTGKTFCFKCILADKKIYMKSKNRGCFINYKSYKKDLKRHESSIRHLQAVIKFKKMGVSDIIASFKKEESEAEKFLKNKRDKNIRYLTEIVRTIIFLTSHGIPLRGKEDGNIHNRKGNFIAFLNHKAFNNAILFEKLQNKTNNYTSPEIQNEFLEIINDQIKNKIKKELRDVKFVSIIADETTDCSNNSQLIVVLKYFHEKKVKERCISLINISDNKSANNIAEKIINLIKEYEIENKLTFQCYDGAPVMSGSKKGVQAIIKENFNNVRFIHCYAHQLNLIADKLLRENMNLKNILEIIDGIIAFFAYSPKKNNFLKKFIIKKIPKLCRTRWNYNIRSVSWVYENFSSLKICLKSLLDSKKEFTKEDRNKIVDIANNFGKIHNFNEKLGILTAFFKTIDVLFQKFQSKSFNIDDCQMTLKKSYDSLNNLSKKSEGIIDICFINNFYSEIYERLITYCNLSFLNLFHKMSEKQSDFKLRYIQNIFKDAGVEKTLKINSVDLGSELFSIVKSMGNKIKSFDDFIRFLDEFEENEFLNCRILAEYISVIPSNTASAERAFSNLKYLKSHLRTTQTDERTESILLIYSEIDISKQMECNDTEIRNILKVFMEKKDRKIDLGLL